MAIGLFSIQKRMGVKCINTKSGYNYLLISISIYVYWIKRLSSGGAFLLDVEKKKDLFNEK